MIDLGRFNHHRVFRCVRSCVHEIDIIGDVYPMKGDMGQKLSDSKFFEVVVLLLK